MHVAEDLLIRTHHKEAQHWRVLRIVLRHWHGRCDTVTVDVVVNRAVGVTGNVQQHRAAFRRMIQPFQRQNREQLVDTPGIRHRLEQGEVDVHFVRHTFLQLVDNRTVCAVARIELLLHFMAHVQIELLRPRAFLQAKGA